jgi:hypothetical protein
MIKQLRNWMIFKLIEVAQPILIKNAKIKGYRLHV